MSSIRPAVEAAYTATAERLNPGSGTAAAKHAKNMLMTIDGTQENLSARFGSQELQIALPVVVEKKHPDGDPVTIGKPHDGVLVVYSDGLIFIRKMGFGAVEIKAHSKSEVTSEPVAAILDGTEVAGLRLNAGHTFALAVAQSDQAADPAASAAVRDEALAALTG